MRAYQYFIQELNDLSAFFKATIYSYEQTENLVEHYKQSRQKFDMPNDLGFLVKYPHLYKTKRSSKIEIRKNLSETVFVRLISALEVFLVDLIKDAFLANKEPFKKQDIILQFTQAELLSIKSPAEVFTKVINKECRKLSTGGFGDIIKYYKKNFNIDLAGFTPGKSKMEEYHDRRHLLVHRLGKTDQQYRDKYNFSKQTITINEAYLFDCIGDFKTFSEMVNNQILYKLKTDFVEKNKKEKLIERKLVLVVLILKSSALTYFETDYEFWAGDTFSMFTDILDDKKQVEENKFEFAISGTFQQIRSYTRIIRRIERQKEITLEITKEKIAGQQQQNYSQVILDEEILAKIEDKLPIQPWQKGIHKLVAEELNVTNKLVSVAIQQLIAKGIFKQQVDGVIIEDKNERTGTAAI